jgi:hypothetical protein
MNHYKEKNILKSEKINTLTIMVPLSEVKKALFITFCLFGLTYGIPGAFVGWAGGLIP